jgi:quinol monooxygenase YgiN
MIIFTMQITIDPDHQTEFLAACHAVLRTVRSDPGCLSCRLTHDTEEPTSYSLQGEWATRGDLDRHLRTDHFKILVGAARTLSGEPQITMSITPGGKPTLLAC